MAAAVQVVGGVDPHADTVYVAALTAVGKVIGDSEFPANAAGYAAAVQFLVAQGVVDRVGVEGAACGRDRPHCDKPLGVSR
jgi:transposase